MAYSGEGTARPTLAAAVNNGSLEGILMMFSEIQAAHFNTISREPMPHVLVERMLLQIAGDQAAGNKFRTEVLAAAGWKHSSLVSFGKYPDEAAKAFNRIRLALAESEDPAVILQLLNAG